MEHDRPISVLVVDDHPAVRAGVRALVDAEPGLLALDAVCDAFAAMPAVRSLRPDVVVLDYQLPGMDGLSLCRELLREPAPPAPLIYSAFAGEDMVVPAHIAGVRAIVDKTAEPRQLALAIRHLAAGETLLPAPTPELLQAAGHRVVAEDLPLLGMLVNGVGPRSVAQTLGIDGEGVEQRITRVLSRMVIRTPAT